MSTDKQLYPRMLYRQGDLSSYVIADSAEHEKALLADGWLHHDDAIAPDKPQKGNKAK